MKAYSLLYLTSLVTFSFGALTFSALTVLYVREWAARRRRRGSVLPAFTLICAFSFLINLAVQAVADSIGLTLALNVATSLIPPCMFHLIFAAERHDLPAARAWRWLLRAFYLASAGMGVAKGLADTGLVPIQGGDQDAAWFGVFSPAPAIALGLAALLALAAQFASRR